MTTRYLKIDDVWIMGKNSKKLRYIINKGNTTITLKFPLNWSENASDDLKCLYPEYSIIEDSTKKRGRPEKKKHRNDENGPTPKLAAIYDTDDEIDYEIGDRVKSKKNGLIGVGEIIGFNHKYAKIRFVDKIMDLHVKYIEKARGRRAKSKIEEKKDLTIKVDNYTLEWLKYEGKLYLINNLNEVAAMNGDYIGVYKDGVIVVV
tara:strand:- start:147 stop:758 length:612 start_codon:yes stop_codon:yes gene_type:complete